QHVNYMSRVRTQHSNSTKNPGGPASVTALQTILAAGELLRANASAVVSPDATSIEPEWMERLLRPVARDNVDLVTPVYGRQKSEGLLVRSLVYPMSRALYAKRVREPYPTEFAFSGRLGSHFLGQDIWSQEVGHIGAEIYLVISAIAGRSEEHTSE